MKRTLTAKASQGSTHAGDSTMMQRVCIALLALVLCIGLMPSFAWATGEEDAATDVDADSQEAVVDESGSDEEEAVDIAVFAYDGDIDDSAEDEAIEDDDVEGDEVDANVPMFLADDDDENDDDDEDENGSKNSNASANNGAVIASSSAVVYDDEKAKTLFDNLVKRFSKGGEDAAISNDTVYAAIGLDMLGLGDDIDADAVLKNLNDVEKPTAGVLAKYIMALTAAGEDCTHVLNDSGGTHDLISEMDELISVDDMDIYSAVWILSAYLYKPYEQGEKCEMSIDSLVEFILNSHDEDNLFGDSEYGCDTQTTAQAIYALSLYYADLTEGAERDDPDLSDSDKLRFDAMDAMEDAAKAIIKLQNSDGGIGYSHEYPESSIDATANATVALQLLGYDTTDPESLNRDDEATPIGYLVDEADEDLNGYIESGTYNEPMTASTVLMALSAVDSDTTLRDDGYTSSGSTYPTYDLNDWLGNSNTGTTGTNNGTSATPSSGSGYTSPTSSLGNGSTLAKTGDDNTPIAIATGIVALCALAVALVAARRLHRLHVNQ